LQVRREYRELFEKGDYVPLQASDLGEEHVCAFLRRWNNQTAVVVTPRLILGLTGGRDIQPIGESVWRESCLMRAAFQPGQKFTNIFSNEIHLVSKRQGKRGLPLAEVLKHFPVALLFSG
jgi:(1->4)-alpha-D-glucan 1-alpha-D-glucosylmutase